MGQIFPSHGASGVYEKVLGLGRLHQQRREQALAPSWRVVFYGHFSPEFVGCFLGPVGQDHPS